MLLYTYLCCLHNYVLTNFVIGSTQYTNYLFWLTESVLQSVQKKKKRKKACVIKTEV